MVRKAKPDKKSRASHMAGALGCVTKGLNPIKNLKRHIYGGGTPMCVTKGKIVGV